ncbi:Histidine phosphatase superfamily (branch 1) [Marinobacter gudaonensis]|uniref:Histidine phosphatase superfamily (Branch 1) n=2 Tax=Marinobacter gudaonensis TaxID=375760 RepID=A0A1I6HLG9_9GAMM|nr:Histidine phosphatase superfamily (branch 1) [Marinobacter gudaonensis]
MPPPDTGGVSAALRVSALTIDEVLMMRTWKILGVVFATFLSATAVGSESHQQAWEALKDGRAVLMLRHALAPGTGDPANFDLDDCSTQRNLNDTGREQARAWKPFLAEHGITEARVFSSQWCRCMDTAREMAMGEVTEWPSLNSFFSNRGDGPAQTRQTIALVNQLGSGAPVILVSHQVNITALAGIFPSSNEGVIISLPLAEEPTILARVSPGR